MIIVGRKTNHLDEPMENFLLLEELFLLVFDHIREVPPIAVLHDYVQGVLIVRQEGFFVPYDIGVVQATEQFDFEAAGFTFLLGNIFHFDALDAHQRALCLRCGSGGWKEDGYILPRPRISGDTLLRIRYTLPNEP